MTAKSVSQSSPETASETQSSSSSGRSRSFRPLAWLGGLLFRLALLGVGGSLAAVGGVLLALAGEPPASVNPPWAWVAWEQLQARSGEPEPEPPAPIASPSPPPPPPEGTVTAEQRAQLQQQVEGLNDQLETVVNSTTALEQEIGLETAAQSDTDADTDTDTEGDEALPAAEQPLVERLQAISQAIQALPAAPAPPPPVLPPLPENAEIQLGGTLRSPYDLDSIFDENNAISEQGRRQLFHLVQELAQYPGATVRIGVHLDNQAESDPSRALSFQLAQALEQYLRSELSNGDAYTWIPLGFGSSRPLVPNDSGANRQRNRRVEVGVN